jgi:NitT/TauT family transport system permease protein
MTTAATEVFAYAPKRPNIIARFFRSTFVAILVVAAAILAIWYLGAVALNTTAQNFADERAGITRDWPDFIKATWSQDKPRLPAPHQVAVEIYNTTVLVPPNAKRSLVYHAWVTLSSTLVGFVIGTLLGIGLAILIVHVPSLDRSLMPWIVSSQTIPILAIAPMVIVVLAAVGVVGLLPKAIISMYLSFFPVTVGMVKGLRSPEPMHLDLMRTYNASRWQTFWKLRWPSALPFLFVSMKIAVAAALVGAIVGEMPTGAVAGLGARLLTGSYYGQTIQIWAALLAAALMAAVLVGIVGLVGRLVFRHMGARPA